MKQEKVTFISTEEERSLVKQTLQIFQKVVDFYVLKPLQPLSHFHCHPGFTWILSRVGGRVNTRVTIVCSGFNPDADRAHCMSTQERLRSRSGIQRPKGERQVISLSGDPEILCSPLSNSIITLRTLFISSCWRIHEIKIHNFSHEELPSAVTT